jgi:hypothetical protein
MHMKYAVGTTALALLVATTGVVKAQGQAQIRIDRDGVQFGPSLDPYRHGYEHAYRDGADHARSDRATGTKYKVNSKQARDTANGYQPFMGDRGQYQAGYRDGYKAGYDAGYSGSGPEYGEVYGRTDSNRNQWDQPTDPYASHQWGASDLAYDVGYRDGVTSGRYDHGQNARPNYEQTDAYRKANHGYTHSYGDSSAYQTQYRTGFQRGYQDGYGRSR